MPLSQSVFCLRGNEKWNYREIAFLFQQFVALVKQVWEKKPAGSYSHFPPLVFLNYLYTRFRLSYLA